MPACDGRRFDSSAKRRILQADNSSSMLRFENDLFDDANRRR